MNGQPTILAITDILQGDAMYSIPIYQRNYDWSIQEWQQLLDDIRSIADHEVYYLGSLVVHYHVEVNNCGVIDSYEVIDGQQRLTTLFALLAALNKRPCFLTFEHRQLAAQTLTAISEGRDIREYDARIYGAYKYFKTQLQQDAALANKLDRIKLLRIGVPEHTDMNHYFELMNTRGKQLEQHEVLKARLMSSLNGNDREVFAAMWQACANMKVPLPDMTQLISEARPSDEADTHYDGSMDLMSAMDYYDQALVNDNTETLAEYEPILTFSQLLMHALRIYIDSDNIQSCNEDMQSLDDKKLLQQSKINEPMQFVDVLFKVRQLFDHYVIKRKYDHNSLKDSWHVECTEQEGHDRFMMLQAMLRVNYTSSQSAHWLTVLLNALYCDEYDIEKLINLLENYVHSKLTISELQNLEDYRINWLYFNYLEYLLWKNREKVFAKPESKELAENYRFTFRNSIEHLYPQHPDADSGLEPLEPGILHHFGNLFLLNVSENSKFSNMTPIAKLDNYRGKLPNSLKLLKMGELLDTRERNGLSIECYKELIDQHGECMKNILKNDLEKRKFETLS